MSESGDTTSPAGDTAGALLRAARQAQGLHVAALATTLKVPPRKLEALENDRYEEFQGATFVRALAQAACRALKIDPAPVLEKLPGLDNGALSQLERGLNAPFREKGARRESVELPGMSGTVVAVVAVLVIGALAFLFWPADWRLPSLLSPSAVSPATSDTPEHVNAPPADPVASAVDPVFPSPALPSTGIPNAGSPSVPGVTPAAVPVPTNRPASAAASAPALLPAASAPVGSLPAPAASMAATAAGGSLLKLQARAASWVEVVDGRSQVLISRTLAAGESVGFDGVLPLRVKIGNVSGTDVAFRGRAVDLAPLNRDNVAKLELK